MTGPTDMNLVIWLLVALVDWTFIAAAIVCAHSFSEPWIYAVTWLVIGNRQHALAILGHDGGHKLICKSRWLNDSLTYLFCFGPLFASMGPYRNFHFAHHRHLGSDQDPELLLAPKNLAPLTALSVIRSFCLDLLGAGLPELIAFANFLKPISWIPFAWWAAFAALMLGIGYWDGLLLFAVSIGTSYWAWFRCRTYTEHYGIKGTSIIKPNLLVRLICPHNTWAHYEHHERPSTPFWKLAALRRVNELGLGN